MQSVLRVIIGLLLLVCALGGSFSKKHTVTLTIGDQTVSLAPGKCNVVNVDSSSGLINRRLLRTEGGAVGVQNDHVEVGRVECLSCELYFNVPLYTKLTHLSRQKISLCL